MPKLQKGSQEAKDYMKVVREQRTTKKKIDYETDSGEKTQKNIIIDLDKKTQKDEYGNVYETTTKIQTVDKPEKQKKTKKQKKQKKQKDNLGNNEIIEDVVIDAEPLEVSTTLNTKEPSVIRKTRGRKPVSFTEEEKKYRKRLQTDISNYNKRIERGEKITEHRQKIYENAKQKLEELMSGKGLLQDISSGLKTVGKKVKSAVKSAIKNVEEYGKAVIYGREDYPPKVRAILKEHGNEIIRSLTIMRTPVPKVLTGALSLFSGGEFGKRMERAFDELFHLFLEIETENGKRLSVEKNEVINMDINPVKRDKTETKEVSNIPSGLSITAMLDETEKRMGKKYFSYSAKDNNCQDFIVAIFKANSIGDESDITFIKQDTKQLFQDLPYLRKFANTITDLGSRINVITTGAGLSQENYMVQSVIFTTDKWTIQKAKKWLKENNYKVPRVDEKEEHLRFRQNDPTKIESKGFTEYRTIPLGENSGISLIISYKKNKISQKDITKMPRTKKMKGSGAIPTQVLVEKEVLGKSPHVYGGGICAKCCNLLEEDEPCTHMEGGKIDIAGAFKKLGRTINKTIVKPAEKAVAPIEKQVANYITAKKGGLATDIEKYGIPAVASATLGGLATLATGGNPVAGVAGSALGSKLGSMGATELEKATGTGIMKRKGRFEKGSQEAKDYMKAMREKRGKK